MLNTAMRGLGGAAIVICGLSAAAAAAEVRVGSFAGMTGPVAETSADVTQARSLAASQVNAQGGLFAAGDRLELLLADSACDARIAVEAGRALVDEARIVAALAPLCSGAARALAESVAIPAGMAMIADAATARSLSLLADGDLVYRVAPSDAAQARALVGLALSEGRRRISVAHASDPYNAELATLFVQGFEAAGGEVARVHAHEAGRIDYSREAALLAADGADALAVFAYYNSSGIDLLDAALDTGAFARIYGADGLANPEVERRIGAGRLDALAILAPATDRTTEAWARFAAAAEEIGLDPLMPYAAQAYDAAFLLALAIERAGAPDRAAIARALRPVANPPGDVILPGEWARAKAAIAGGEPVDYRGASGPIVFDETGDVAGHFVVWRKDAAGLWRASPLD